MVTWHGLSDQYIYPGGTVDYYRQVLTRDPSAHDYYRFFPAPGVEHCGGGAGATPSDPLAAVVDWVEKGVAPETLPAVTADGTRKRNLCMYPQVAFYTGGDTADANSFVCKTAKNYVDNIISYTDFLLSLDQSQR